MLARNPMRMDYQIKYEEIVAAYNTEKDQASIDETFRLLMELVAGLDEEQKRAASEGMSEDELAIFDLLQKDGLEKTARERIKQASKALLASLQARLGELDRFWEKNRRRRTCRSSSWMKCLQTFQRRRLPWMRKNSLPAIYMHMCGSRP